MEIQQRSDITFRLASDEIGVEEILKWMITHQRNNTSFLRKITSRNLLKSETREKLLLNYLPI
jgi:hypothetical protein